MNYTCRINDVIKKQLDTKMDVAQRAKNWPVFYNVVGQEIGLILIQDRQLETTAVPASLGAKLSPVIRSARSVDTYMHTALRNASSGDTKGAMAELAKSGPTIITLRRQLTAAGLKYCAAVYD